MEAVIKALGDLFWMLETAHLLLLITCYDSHSGSNWE